MISNSGMVRALSSISHDKRVVCTPLQVEAYNHMRQKFTTTVPSSRAFERFCKDAY